MKLGCDTICPYSSPDGGELDLAGEASSPAGIAGVVVQVGGGSRYLAHVSDRRWRVSIPAASVRDRPGPTVVVARAGDGETATLLLEDDLPVPPVTPWSTDEYREALRAGRHLLVCHSPVFDGQAVVDSVIAVEGWSYAPTGVRECWARLGDGPLISVASALPTPGLNNVVGDWPGIEEAGFRAIIATAGIPPGRYRLEVGARAGDGHVIRWGTHIRIDPQGAYLRHLLSETDRTKALPPGAMSAPRVLICPLDAPDSLAPSLHGQSYPWWAAAEPGQGGIQAALRKGAADEADLIVLVADGAELRPGALLELASVVVKEPGQAAFYADHDLRDSSGARHDPWFKPAWSPEHLLAIDYVGPMLALRPGAARAVLSEGEPVSDLYDLALRLVALELPVGHVPRILTTLGDRVPPADSANAKKAIERLARKWRRTVEVGQIDETRRHVSWPIANEPMVSIVIPTKGQDGLISRCLVSIASRTTYRKIEAIVIDTSADGLGLEEQDWGGLAVRVVRMTAPFNFHTACNRAVAEAFGSVLVFVNDDVEPVSDHWMQRMLEYADLPGVGPVGAKLIYPNGGVQHAGVLLLPPYGAANLSGAPKNLGGPHGILGVVRNCIGVTGACLMMRRSAFEAIGGFDEAFVIDYGDVDLCLRSLDSGQRVVYTPHAVLIHHESVSRGRRPNKPDVNRFCDRWSKRYSDDPFYPRAFDAVGMFTLN